MRLHLGHHFYGAGNIGDDLMLAGFLQALERLHARPGSRCHITCCVPYDRVRLANLFPAIHWLPYERETRAAAIRDCDVWLGLGGSPFQSAVSRWFIDHLVQESETCRQFRRPMFFLGVGGQDPDAYSAPEIRSVCNQAEFIWTRDKATAEALTMIMPATRLGHGADLAHLWLKDYRPAPASPQRLAVTLNFDYQSWPMMHQALATLESTIPAREWLWLAQEERLLPGAEKSLYADLSPEQRQRWRLHDLAAEPTLISPTIQPNASASIAFARRTAQWPTPQWWLTGRFHSTLIGAWAGSRVVVINTNAKLHSVALEFGCPLYDPKDNPAPLPRLLQEAEPVSPQRLGESVDRAQKACFEFLSRCGLAS